MSDGQPAKDSIQWTYESLLGMGHHNRSSLVVEAMVNSGFNVTVTSSSFMQEGDFFKGARLVHLPQPAKPTKRKVLSPEQQRLQDLGALRSQFQIKAMLECKPAAFVVEFWPFSRPKFDREMISVIKALKKFNPLAPVVVSMRDVLFDTSDAANPVSLNQEAPPQARDRTTEIIKRYVDAVVVHGDKSLIDLSETFSGVRHIADRIGYSGYVIGKAPDKVDMCPTKRPILVSFGAGAVGWEHFKAVADAYPHSENKDRVWHFISGPKFPSDQFAQLVEKLQAMGQVRCSELGLDCENPQFILERYRSDFKALLANCALAVSGGGYNTTLEVVQYGVDNLFIPYFKKLDYDQIWYDTEQTYRLRKLSGMGVVNYIEPKDAVNPAMLASAIDHAFKNKLSPTVQIDFGGAQNTVGIIRRQIEAKRRGIAVRV